MVAKKTEPLPLFGQYSLTTSIKSYGAHYDSTTIRVEVRALPDIGSASVIGWGHLEYQRKWTYGSKTVSEFHWYLSSVRIKAEYQRKGLGTFLLAELWRAAQSVRRGPMVLCVSPFDKGLSRPRLWRWYQRRGFRRLVPSYAIRGSLRR